MPAEFQSEWLCSRKWSTAGAGAPAATMSGFTMDWDKNRLPFRINHMILLNKVSGGNVRFWYSESNTSVMGNDSDMQVMTLQIEMQIYSSILLKCSPNSNFVKIIALQYFWM